MMFRDNYPFLDDSEASSTGGAYTEDQMHQMEDLIEYPQWSIEERCP